MDALILWRPTLLIGAAAGHSSGRVVLRAGTTAASPQDNAAPTATLSNNGPINEGGSATISFTNKADASSADTAAGFHYAFHCDGSAFATPPAYAGSGTADSTTCSFADNGTYPVKAAIIDKDGGSNGYSTNVVVNNAAPSVTAAADQSSNEGQDKAFNLGSFSDAGTNDGPWAVDVNWGDGSNHTTFNATSQGALGSKSHSYDDNGSYTVTLSVTDKDTGTRSATFKANVANVRASVGVSAGSSAVP